MSIWRQIQKENITDWRKLVEELQLDLQNTTSAVISRKNFPLNLPKRLAKKISKGDWNDPILRQFLPLEEELQSHPLFVLDPVGDNHSRIKPKLLQKYFGRALLVCTSACAMHCRYCFRQHFDYDTEDKLFEEELEEITKETSITEILLSGGDPLSLSDAQLRYLLESLDRIPHVRRIRFHTRFPMGIPERIDDALLNIFAACCKQIVFVIHCNHPKEFDSEIFAKLKSIQRLGIPIFTQTVLLRGINDDVNTLKDLFELLIDHGIIPNYLNQLDRVQGTAHFEVSEEEGKEIMQQLGKILPGYAVPKYIREIPGEPRKVPLI